MCACGKDAHDPIVDVDVFGCATQNLATIFVVAPGRVLAASFDVGVDQHVAKAAVKNADFTNAKHLGEEQLAESVGDASTILPVNILMPQTDTWTDKVLPSETFFSLWRNVKKQAGLT